MPPNRRSSPSVPDYNRIASRVEDSLAGLTERLEGIADRLDKRLERVERDIAGLERTTASASSEIAASRLDTGELRDGLAKLRQDFEDHKAGPVEAAAEGAAKGAAAATRPLVEEIVPNLVRQGVSQAPIWRKPILIFIACCIGFTAAVTAAKELPGFGRWLWHVAVAAFNAPGATG